MKDSIADHWIYFAQFHQLLSSKVLVHQVKRYTNKRTVYITYVLLIILFIMRENMIWARFYSQRIPIVGCRWGGGGEIPNYTKKYYRLPYKHGLWRVKVKGWGYGVVMGVGLVENELHRRQSSWRILMTQTASTNHWKCCGFALTLTHAEVCFECQCLFPPPLSKFSPLTTPQRVSEPWSLRESCESKDSFIAVDWQFLYYSWYLLLTKSVKMFSPTLERWISSPNFRGPKYLPEQTKLCSLE